jgi:DNA-directed RNA polymerase subunit RPC12/RpoP
MLKFHCEHCSHKISVKDELVGRKVKCPKCNQPTTVRDESTNGDTEVLEPAEYTIEKSLLGKHMVDYRCPVCMAELSSDLDYAGQTHVCPTCKRTIRVPGRAEHEKLLHDAEARAAQEESNRLRQIEQAAAAKLARDRVRQHTQQQRKSRPRSSTNPLAVVADQFLAWSFSVAKYISVLIVAGCFAVALICIFLLLTTQPDIPKSNPPAVVIMRVPGFTEFQQSLPAPQQESPAVRGGTPSAPSGYTPPQRSAFELRVDKLASTYSLPSALVALIKHKLGVDFESAFAGRIEPILGDKEKESFLGGVEQLLDNVQRYLRSPNANPAANVAQAARWYVLEYQENEAAVKRSEEARAEAIRDAQRQADLARQIAAERRRILILILGITIAALLAFLFLPLLIQVEHHLRELRQQPQPNSATNGVSPAPVPTPDFTNIN